MIPEAWSDYIQSSTKIILGGFVFYRWGAVRTCSLVNILGAVISLFSTDITIDCLRNRALFQITTLAGASVLAQRHTMTQAPLGELHLPVQ